MARQFTLTQDAEVQEGVYNTPILILDEDGDPVEFAGGPVSVAAEDVSVEASAGIVGANVQAVLADLAARVVALEAV